MPDWTARSSALVEIDLYDGAYGPTILLVLVTRRSIDWLRKVFEDMAAAPTGTVVSLTDLPQVRVVGELGGLVLSKAERCSRPDLVRGVSGRFVWSCTADDWDTMSLMLEPLLRQPGHQYLTSEGVDDALIEVSFGEALRRRSRGDSAPPSPACG